MPRALTFLLALLLPMASLADTPVPPQVRQAIARVAPGQPVSNVTTAPMPGFYQALVRGRMIYVSQDGRYVMAGDLFDTRVPLNLTKASMRVLRRQALATIPASDRIIYAPPHPAYTVTVFTDLDCTYCRVFHQHIAQYNAEGIAVEYVFWPRSGVKAVPSGKPTPSYLKAVSVWCAKDRKQAFTEAKQGRSVPAATCANPVAREYRLGKRIGIDGTPMIVAADGTLISGYLPPAQLLEALRMNRIREKLRQGAQAGPRASSQR